jgi:hypothetical protein
MPPSIQRQNVQTNEFTSLLRIDSTCNSALKNAHGKAHIPELLDTQILERQLEAGANQLRDPFSHRDAARGRDSLQPRRDVDVVTVDVFSIGDDVAAAQTHAEDDAVIAALALAAFDHPLLHLDSAPHGVEGCLEFGQYAIAGGFHKSGPVFDNHWIDQLAAMSLVEKVGSLLIQTRQP